MEYTARLPAAQTLSRRITSRVDAPALSAWTLAFALVTYLAMRDGGYDTIVRSEAGVAVWWIILLVALAGILPARIGRAGWGAIGLLGAFALWTGLAVGWSMSPGDTITELGREATYLGFLVLAIVLQGRTAARHTINGLASAFGVVTALAVLSRLHPQAFPTNVQFQFLGPVAGSKLSYPLNYWNALAAFAAMGVPLLVTVAISARTKLTRALAAGTLPLSALCIYLTLSRGGALELCVGAAVLLALVPRRLQATGTLLAGGAGGGILIWGASNRPAVRSGLTTHAALHQGGELLVLAVIVCLGVALLQAAMAVAARELRAPALLRPARRQTAQRALVLVLVAVVAAVAAGVPGKLANDWHQFKSPNPAAALTSSGTVFSRLSAVNSDGRFQFWQAALHAFQSAPLIGIGPGTFQYWWAAHATVPGSIVNAHSLYFETLAETGIIGLVLIGGLLVWFLGTAIRRSLSAHASTSTRIAIAGAAAGLATFMTSAAIEWVWQMAAIAAAALAMGAVIVAAPGRTPARLLVPTPPRRVPRTIMAIVAIVAVVAVSIPLAAAVAIRQSQNAAAAGNLGLAYQASLTAERIEPYSVAPRLQEALVLEAGHDLEPAATAARLATEDAATDWQAWLTLARIDAQRGAARSALAAFAHARALDPLNTLWKEQ